MAYPRQLTSADVVVAANSVTYVQSPGEHVRAPNGMSTVS
jgi:hypothetical protein